MIKKIGFLSLFFFLVIHTIAAQEPLKHEKKIYVSPEGKLFIQKYLPVYLRIATSPDDDAPSYLLRSEESSQYSNPMYFDTEGYNTVRSPSAVDTSTHKTVYPLRDIVFEVYSDSRPPVTNVDFGDYKTFKKEGKFFLKGSFKLILKARDVMSGVENIYYSINMAPFKTYTDSLQFDEEKEYEIKYYAVDHVGNAEEVKTMILVIDDTKPVTKLEIKGDEYESILSGRSSISLNAEDQNGIREIYYSIDGGQERTFNSPVSSTYLSQGEHVLTYYAVDQVNNIEDPQTYEFYVDKTPPTIVEEILGNTILVNGQEYSSGRSRIKLTTFDNKAGIKEVYYSINDGEYQLYEKPFSISLSGKLQLKSYAVDNVNNKSVDDKESIKSSLPYIDLSGPTVKYSFTGPVFTARDTIYISDKTKILLTARDQESGLQNITYSIDAGEILTYKEPFEIENEGKHKISITAMDQVENTNILDFVVMVDKSGPEIFSRFSLPPLPKNQESNGVDFYPGYVVLFLSATDQVVGFEKMFFKTNDEAEKLYSNYISSFLPGKEYSVKVRAVDKLGNNTEEIIRFNTIE